MYLKDRGSLKKCLIIIVMYSIEVIAAALGIGGEVFTCWYGLKILNQRRHIVI